MKKVFLLSIYLFAMLSLVLSGCDKDESEETDTPPATPTASMTAKIEGVDWSANQSGCTITDGIAGIVGVASQAQTILLTLSEFEEGIIPLEFNGNSVGVVMDGNVAYSTNSDPEATGIVNITSINTTDSLVSGTFEFYAYSPNGKGFVSVSDGSFKNIPFTTEIPGTPNNSLVVDIDGSTFTPTSVTASVLLSKIYISASDAQVTETVGLTVNEDISVGTYDISSLFGDVTAMYLLDSITMTPTSGTLIITKHDESQNILEGTFGFEAEELLGTNTASLTNGSFKVNY